MTSREIRPGEVALRNRCNIRGLNEAQTEVVVDLFGWYIKEGCGVKNSRYLHPQMRIVTDYQDAPPQEKEVYEAKAKIIADIIRQLLGAEHCNHLSENPETLLLGKLKMHQSYAAWIVVQLELHKKHQGWKDLIRGLNYIAPENMPREIVSPTLAILLDLE